MLDIVPAQQDQLALPVEVVDVDDAEPWLAGAAAGARQHGAPAGKPSQHEREQRQEDEDDGEGDGVMDRRGVAETELG